MSYNRHIFSPGIQPLVGWEWIKQHEHDLDGWEPSIEIIRPGAKYTIKSKDTATLNAAIHIIVKENK